MAPDLENGIVTFRVIEGSGEKRNPQRETAEQNLAVALREAAANVLRIIRGAGRPDGLINDFNDVLLAAMRFKEAAGHWAPSSVIAGAIARDDEADEIFRKHAAGQIRQELIDRWDSDGTFDEMYALGTIQRGALQIIASKLLDQQVQISAGSSELHAGIRRLNAARDRKTEKREANSSVRVVRKKRGRKPAPLPSKPRQRDE